MTAAVTILLSYLLKRCVQDDRTTHMANIDISRRAAWKALPLVQVVGKARARLTTSAVALVDSIARRADAYWQVGSSNCAGKKSRSRRCPSRCRSQRGHRP